jgi:hypothetical protein
MGVFGLITAEWFCYEPSGNTSHRRALARLRDELDHVGVPGSRYLTLT